MSSLTYDQAVPHSASRIGGLSFDWLVAALSGWMILGAYLDGWAHVHLTLESFFTPWHAVVYSGFASLALVVVGAVLVNRRHGASWGAAIPPGYRLAVLGVPLFLLSAMGDSLWHFFFGIETDIAAASSPTHLALVLTGAMIMAGPLQAAGLRSRGQAARRVGEGWAVWGPRLLAASALLAGTTIFTIYDNPFAQTWMAMNRRPTHAGPGPWPLEQALGLADVFLYSAILVGGLLILIRHWGPRLPFGSLTFLMGVNITAMALINDIYLGTGALPLIGVGLLGGLAADGLLVALRPAVDRPNAVRVFAVAVPTVLFSLYLLAILLFGGGTWWAIHLAAAVPVLAGLTGGLISYMVIPPLSLPAQAAE